MNIHAQSASHIISPVGLCSFYIYNHSQSPFWSIQSQYQRVIQAHGTIIHNTGSPIAGYQFAYIAQQNNKQASTA